MPEQVGQSRKKGYSAVFAIGQAMTAVVQWRCVSTLPVGRSWEMQVWNASFGGVRGVRYRS